MDTPTEPQPMSWPAKIAYAALLPLSLLVLLFVPAGRFDWRPGWALVGVLAIAFALSTLAIARTNPALFRARSRFQPGTERWDLALLTLILPAMAAIVPLAALDAGRFHWSIAPLPVMIFGHCAVIAGIAGTAWAQSVNPFFEPGVRIQSERHQRVIDTGPYAVVRHPGYSAALLLLPGLSLALGSYWGLVPAAIAAILLVVRTIWEDRLLHQKLPGYPEYSLRVRARLVPGIW